MYMILWPRIKKLLSRVKVMFKEITKPTTASLTVNGIIDMTRSRKDLVTENAILRQQLIVVNRR